MEPKSFYLTYQANNEIYDIDRMLINEVLKDEPRSVLDFGTGTGKNLRLLLDTTDSSKEPINVCGLDVSFLNIMYAKAKNEIPFLICGDEYFLCRLKSFDVIMTCSVLCHIRHIDTIISDFKDIAQRSIIIAETNDVVGEFYYPHNYESYGFVDLQKDWYSEGNQATYKFYRYERMP
jgi:2-polyprenyl-3-methyl-5-hydroxy-6-metoxy-1,4-benzoquinol methylase